MASAILTGHSTSDSSMPAATSRIPGTKRASIPQFAAASIVASANAGPNLSGRATASRKASARSRGRRAIVSSHGRASLSVTSLRRKRRARAGSSALPASHPPAGQSATTESARPLIASSRLSHPPIELPTRWARSMPSASSWRSRTSTISRKSVPSSAGSEGPPWCHAAVGAKIEWRASSSGRTGVQARQQLLKPCSRTIGSPVPPR